MPEHDVEWLALAAGRKPAIRRTVEPARAAEVEGRMRGAGFAVERAEGEAYFGGRAVAVVYAARDPAAARALREAEAPILPRRPSPTGGRPDLGAHREVGRLLGFPACCVEAFVARLVRGVDVLPPDGPRGLHEDYVAARAAACPTPDARLNPLLMQARAQLVSFYACAFDCVPAREHARGVVEAVEAARPGATREILGLLARPLAIASDGARAFVVLGAGRSVVAAEAPRGPSGRPLGERDDALAAALVGAEVSSAGLVVSPAAAPPLVVPFALAAAQ